MNEFPETKYRARCTNVVDGDTVDLVVDIGFHITFSGRFRLLGIDTDELNSKIDAERVRAQAAKAKVIELLKPSTTGTGWPLIVRTMKDTDSFGRWLVEILFTKDDGSIANLGSLLIDENLAKTYKR